MFDRFLYDKRKYDVSGSIILIQNLLHSQTIDNISLIQQHLLAIQDLLHSQSIDNLTLTWSYLLVIQDILHSQNIDETYFLAEWKEKLTEAKTWVEKGNVNQPWVEKGG